MSTISICVIAKNEAKNVKQLSDSVKSLFDEYIFVDTGSNDGTQELAKKNGWNVSHFDWVNDFSAARNHSFSLATSDFIMWLDLDDVLENQEGFKNWKEVVMPIHDYHLANYHYASDSTGKPICTFVRERVVRRSKEMKWEYALHEGITPNSANSQPVSINFTTAWQVRHMRTAEDLAQDKTRNLAIFDKIKSEGKMNPRMQYYFGKELFEHGDTFKSIPELERALSDRNLDLHDRIIATQYLAFAHVQAAERFKDDAQKEKAHHYAQAQSHCMNGLMVAPTRAELYNIIGDSFIKMGKLLEAIPFYSAARNCLVPPQSHAPSPIFRHDDAYGPYPLMQLARCYANLQRFEEARVYAREAFDKGAGDEARKILAEIDGITTSAESYKLAEPCSDIVFTTPPQHAYPFDEDMMRDKAMGGSETAEIMLAKHIKKKLPGRKVKIFMMRSDNKVCNGVEYLSNAGLVQYMAKNKPALHIAWRHNIKLTDAPTYIHSHDLMTHGVENLDNFNKVLCLTNWHASYMSATQGVPMSKIHVTRNGVMKEKFKLVDFDKKDPMQFVFGSSPDRGLNHCIRVLDEVRKHYPVKLRIHYGWDHWGECQGRPDLLQTKNQLIQMVKERDWIEYKGSTQQDELMESYRQAAYNVQPSEWLETSGISAYEFVFNGVYPIFRKIGGIADTLKPFVEAGMAELVEQDGPFQEKHVSIYADRVLSAIKEEKFRRVTPDNIENYTWEKVAEEWIRDLLPGE